MTDKKKMGRPTTNPKTNVARLRLSDSERYILDECCRISGMTISEVLKTGINKVHAELTNQNEEKAE